VDQDPIGHKPEHPPGQSVWPIGFAIGVACVLVGLVISWWVVAIGGAITILFAVLWIADLTGHPVGGGVSAEPEPVAAGARGAARHHAPPRTSRSGFLGLATLGLGAVIGALVTIPPLFLAMIPPFLKQSKKPIDLGPLHLYPLNQWRIVTFRLVSGEGPVWNRTAYIRYNGPLNGQPSFTIISNRCAHLGCPVQPLGLVQPAQARTIQSANLEPVRSTPVIAVSGFSCPCHGGAYDTEGNRTAGPPVRALDRYEYSIVKGRLVLGTNYSVAKVVGTGAQATIYKHKLYGPGQHVDGWEQIFYPWTPPS
jgi:quinol---cytochrome c reductase iron-sulfur subunit, bacillus type